MVDSLQRELERVKRLVLSDDEKTRVILNQEKEINRLRAELEDYKRREVKWALRHQPMAGSLPI